MTEWKKNFEHLEIGKTYETGNGCKVRIVAELFNLSHLNVRIYQGDNGLVYNQYGNTGLCASLGTDNLVSLYEPSDTSNNTLHLNDKGHDALAAHALRFLKEAVKDEDKIARMNKPFLDTKDLLKITELINQIETIVNKVNLKVDFQIYPNREEDLS